MCAFLSMFVVFSAGLAAQGEAPLKRRVLIVTPQDDAAGTDALYGAFAARGEAVAEGADRQGVDEPVAEGAFARVRIDAVRDRMVEAKAALREFRYPEVRKKLDDAEALLLRAERPELHLALYRELLLMRAGLDVADGNTTSAEADLMLVSRLDPTLKVLHPGLYPPPLVAAYASATEKANTGGTGVVVVVPRVPAGEKAVVWLDGRPVKQRRATMTLPAGPHLLSMGAPGRLTVTRRLDVLGGSSTVMEPFLPQEGIGKRRAQTRDAMRGELYPDARATAARSLLTMTGSTVLVWRGVQELHVYDLSGRVLGPLPRGKTPLDDASTVLTALNQPVAPVVSPIGPTNAPPPEDETPDIQVIAGVTGAGLGLALALAAAGGGTTATYLVWLFTRPQNPDPPETPIIISCCGPKGD